MPFNDQNIRDYLEGAIQVREDQIDEIWSDADVYWRYILGVEGLKDMIRNPFLLRIVTEVLPGIVSSHEEKGDEEGMMKPMKLLRKDIYDAFVLQWFT